MASNLLSAQSLSSVIAQSLPQGAEPQLESPYDAIAVAVHAALIAVGFRLIGLNEDERLPASPSGTVPELPAEWNAQSPSSFSFVYAHSQSAMQSLLRVNRMGGKAVVTAMAIGDDKPVTFDIKADDYVSPSSLPATPVAQPIPRPPAATPQSDTVSPAKADVPPAVLADIQNIFISAGRLSDLANLVRTRLIQKLLPSLQKEGYEDSPPDPATSEAHPSSMPRPAHHDPPSLPRADPLRMPPRNPYGGEFPPPGFDDEYDLQRPLRPLGDYGRSDLYPAGLGPNDPFSPMGPHAPRGGMHPTFDDPLFAGQGRGRGQAPPGARWDPTGPGGGPRGPGGFPGGGGNPFGGFGSGDFI